MVNLIATGNLGWLNVLSTKLQSSWRRSLIVMQSPLDKCKKLRAVSTCGAMYCQLIPYIGRVHNKSMLIHVKLLSGDKRLSRSETNVTPLNCWILHDFADWLVHERKSCACVKLFILAMSASYFELFSISNRSCCVSTSLKKKYKKFARALKMRLTFSAQASHSHPEFTVSNESAEGSMWVCKPSSLPKTVPNNL